MVPRSKEIDFVKGMLVIAMTVYHWLDFFVTGRHWLYAYVTYVAESFVFVSGALCGLRYRAKYASAPTRVMARLLIRGGKLVVLFCVLNLAVHSLVTVNYDGTRRGLPILMANAASILIRGNDALTVFDILLPIGYVLAAAAFLLRFPAAALPLLLAVVLTLGASAAARQVLPYNVKAFVIGLGGLASGLLLADHPAWRRRRWPMALAAAAVAAYLALVVHGPVRMNPVIYYGLINAVVVGLYGLGVRLNPDWRASQVVFAYGRYSLLLYLAQIVFFQGLVKLVPVRAAGLTPAHFGILAAVNGMMIATVAAADRLRRHAAADRLYRFVFA